MGLTNENVGPKILAKVKIYVLTRAELLFKVCYEIPCICYMVQPKYFHWPSHSISLKIKIHVKLWLTQSNTNLPSQYL